MLSEVAARHMRMLLTGDHAVAYAALQVAKGLKANQTVVVVFPDLSALMSVSP